MLRKYWPLLFIIFLGVIPLADLFQLGLPLTHDGQDHVARIANFYQSLSEGILIPRWAGNLNWGYGHPVMMFLYPLPSYLASLFHFLGLSLVDSVKMVFGLGFILSGIGMYLWVNRLLGVYAGIFASILYMFAPYRFVNLYVRGAIGEHSAFIFIPFVLLFITRIFLDKQTKNTLVINSVALALSTGALILSHNALSMLFLFFAAFYALALFFNNKEIKKLTSVFLSVMYGFIISAFFWVPAYIEGKYTLRDIVTGGSEYASRFAENPINFVTPSWSYGITGQLSVQIGIVHIALILLAIYIVFKFTKKRSLEKEIFFITFVFFLLSLFMMLKESNFIWSSISILQKFQFPWRFLSLTVLTSALLGAYGIYSNREKKKIVFAIFGLIILVGLFYSSYWRANGYLVKEESFFKNIYHGTTDTGESSPIWSVRFMEKEPESKIEVLSGEAKIEEVYRSSTIHEYNVISSEGAKLKENTLYFPGWNIYVNGRKLDVNTEIEFQNPQNRGIMTFNVSEGYSKVRIVFEDTKVRKVADIISGASLIFLVFILIISIVKKKRA